MKAKIFWNNTHISFIGAYYNETIDEFKHRVLKGYAKYNMPIMLCVRGEEGYYIM